MIIMITKLYVNPIIRVNNLSMLIIALKES